MFKRDRTSVKERPEVKKSSSKPKPERCKLVGQANEVEIYVNGNKCLALLDTGSMVTTVCEDFYNQTLKEECEIQSLDTLLTVTGAGGHHLPYLAFVSECL